MSAIITGDKAYQRFMNDTIKKSPSRVKGTLIKAGKELAAQWASQIDLMGAVDTGDYHGSINIDASQLGSFILDVYSDVEHSTFVEFGTFRMAARPAARLSIDRMGPRIENLFLNMFDKLIR